MKETEGTGLIGRMRKHVWKIMPVIYICAAVASCGEPQQPVGQRHFRDTCKDDLDCEAPYRCDQSVGECRYESSASAAMIEGDTAYYLEQALACPIEGSTVNLEGCVELGPK